MRDPNRWPAHASLGPVLLLLAALSLTATGCSRLGLGQPTPTPAPTEPRQLPLEPIGPGPSSIDLAAADATYAAASSAAQAQPGEPGQDPTLAAAVIETVIAMATAGAASPTAPPVIDPGSAVGTPEPACTIAREPFRFELAPAPEAEPVAVAAWAESRGWAFEAELRALSETEPDRAGEARLELTGAFATRLGPDTILPPAGQPLAPDLPRELPAGLPLRLRYQGPPLPLEPGRRLLVAYDSDQPAGGADGEGLLVADETGLRLLGVSLREAEGAERRVLAGLRAGFSVQQAPTTCRYVEQDGCGFELRAAPLEIAAEDRSVRVLAGELGRLELDRVYALRVATSHLRLWRGDQPCADPADWPRSYRIERLDE